MAMTPKHWLLLLTLLFGAPFLGACEMKCECNGGSDVGDTIDEIGDETEELIEDLREDN